MKYIEEIERRFDANPPIQSSFHELGIILRNMGTKEVVAESIKQHQDEIKSFYRKELTALLEEVAKEVEGEKEEYSYDENNKDHNKLEEILSDSRNTLGEAQQEGRNDAFRESASLIRSYIK